MFDLDYRGIYTEKNLHDKSKPWAMKVKTKSDQKSFLLRVAQSNGHKSIPLEYMTVFDEGENAE